MRSQPVESGGDDAVLREVRAQARANPQLDPAEETRLLELAARGDKPSQERLVASRLGMVVRLAEARDDQGLSVPDLVQEGSIGLVDAVQSFSSSGADDFDAYAEQKVGAQMDAAIAAEAAAVRDGELLVAAANDYERTELLLRRALRRPPTAAEIAEKLEWTVERTQYVAVVVAEARRRHDEELLEFIDPDAIDFDGSVDGE
jgi:DNA-directed RNA polymerase sigma subunit (sigma70/sigma32)